MRKTNISRLGLTNSDVDELRQHYAETLKPVRIDPIDSNRTISVHDLHIKLAAFDIWAGGCSSGMRVSFTEPPDLYALYIPLSGTMEFKRQNSTLISAPGTIFACDLASIDSILLHPQRSHIGIAFDKKMVAEHLEAVTGRPGDRNIDIFDVINTDGDGKQLEEMCKLIWRNLQANPEEGIRQKSNELLLRAITLKLFENLHRVDLLKERHSPAVPRHVKIAIEYMVGHVHLPITINDIAGAAGVSSRGLQLAFQQFKDTTPLSYLRQLRIQHARQDLIATRDSEVTVAAVAKRWGFSNAARFTELYLQVHGETPRETIRKLR